MQIRFHHSVVYGQHLSIVVHLVRRLQRQLKAQRIAKEQSLRVQLQQSVEEPQTLIIVLACVQSLNHRTVGRGDGVGAHLQLVQ